LTPKLSVGTALIVLGIVLLLFGLRTRFLRAL
jgi:Sec-independent protein translocase protein TatA